MTLSKKSKYGNFIKKHKYKKSHMRRKLTKKHKYKKSHMRRKQLTKKHKYKKSHVRRKKLTKKHKYKGGMGEAVRTSLDVARTSQREANNMWHRYNIWQNNNVNLVSNYWVSEANSYLETALSYLSMAVSVAMAAAQVDGARAEVEALAAEAERVAAVSKAMAEAREAYTTKNIAEMWSNAEKAALDMKSLMTDSDKELNTLLKHAANVANWAIENANVVMTHGDRMTA